MEIAKYGRTVIVDDQLEDIIDLMKVLSKEGISTTYFTGEVESLPEEPMDGVSVLFFDLELNKNLNNDRDKASQDISVIMRLLGEHAKDGTVILIVWTTAITLYDELKQMMNLNNMRFLAEIKIEKINCKTNSSFDLEKIKQVLSNELSAISSLNLLNIWDNTINVAVNRVYKKLISNVTGNHQDIEKKINAIYLKMFQAVLGKQVDGDLNKGIVMNESILYSISDLLNEILINEICMTGGIKYTYQFNSYNVGSLGLEEIGDLNKALNLVPVHDVGMPGTIYNLKNNINLNYFEMFNDYKEVKKSNDFKNKLEVMCEVTPLCDYAQKRQKIYRFLPGIIIPVSLEDKLKEKADYLYCTPVLSDQAVSFSPFVMVFDLRYLLTLELNDPELKIFGIQFGQTLLMHIQNRLGRQVSNPGITSIR